MTLCAACLPISSIRLQRLLRPSGSCTTQTRRFRPSWCFSRPTQRGSVRGAAWGCSRKSARSSRSRATGSARASARGSISLRSSACANLSTACPTISTTHRLRRTGSRRTRRRPRS
eukprot:Amastigsp_a344021_10.p3 type:complete len:116 gc:universal Amastigsp_a344021_10:991-644(-)